MTGMADRGQVFINVFLEVRIVVWLSLVYEGR